MVASPGFQPRGQTSPWTSWKEDKKLKIVPKKYSKKCTDRILKSLHQSQGLINGSTHRQVVDGNLAQGALVVDDEEAAQGDARLLQVDPVVLADGGALVRQQGNLQRPQAALLSRGVDPGEVGVVRVGARGDQLGVDLGEIGRPLAEADDLGGTDEGAEKQK